MYLIGKKLKKKHRLQQDVRTSLYDSCNRWLKAIGKDRNFMGGNGPNLADLVSILVWVQNISQVFVDFNIILNFKAVYGVLKSIEGCDAFNDMIEKTKIGKWYYSVQELVKNKAGAHDLEYLKA